MLLLPHPETIRKRCSAMYARAGHDNDRYDTIRSEMAQLSALERNVVVKFDEINIRADLVWKERGGKFELFGVAEDIPGAFILRTPLPFSHAARGYGSVCVKQRQNSSILSIYIHFVSPRGVPL